MTVKNCEPGGVGSPAAALGRSSQPESYRPRRQGQAFCELHHRNVVDELPRLCPFGTPNFLDTIGQLRAAAWREIGTGDALRLLGRVGVCDACITRLAAHPEIRRLRTRKGIGL